MDNSSDSSQPVSKPYGQTDTPALDPTTSSNPVVSTTISNTVPDLTPPIPAADTNEKIPDSPVSNDSKPMPSNNQDSLGSIDSSVATSPLATSQLEPATSKPVIPNSAISEPVQPVVPKFTPIPTTPPVRPEISPISPAKPLSDIQNKSPIPPPPVTPPSDVTPTSPSTPLPVPVDTVSPKPASQPVLKPQIPVNQKPPKKPGNQFVTFLIVSAVAIILTSLISGSVYIAQNMNTENRGYAKEDKSPTPMDNTELESPSLDSGQRPNETESIIPAGGGE